MRAHTPVGRSPRVRSSKIGRRNASVLPVPVWAVATTSRPSRAGGIACACTGVGTANPCLVKLLCSTEHRGNSENLFIQSLLGEKKSANQLTLSKRREQICCF